MILITRNEGLDIDSSQILQEKSKLNMCVKVLRAIHDKTNVLNTTELYS